MSTRLIPLPALHVILGINAVTAWRRAKAGRYGKLYRPGDDRHYSVAASKIEAARGCILSDQEISDAYKIAQAKWLRAYRARHPYKEKFHLPLRGSSPLKGEAGYAGE